MWRPLALLLLAALPAGCGGGGDKPSEPLPEAKRSITVTSPAFRDGGTIPKRFTLRGQRQLARTALVGRARRRP